MSIWAFLFSVRQIYFRVVREIGANHAPTSDRFDGQATAIRSQGVNWSIDQEGSPLPSARSVFRFGPQGRHEENVTFEKVTKLSSERVLGTANFSPF